MGADIAPRQVLDLDAMLDRARRVFESRGEIVCAYLFGSYAHDRQTGLSDLDFAVARSSPVAAPQGPWRTYRGDLHFELTRALDLAPDALDLVVLDETTDPLLRHRATWCGRSIMCRDHRFRVRLEAEILLAYLDTEHLRRIQGSVLARHLKDTVRGSRGD